MENLEVEEFSGVKLKIYRFGRGRPKVLITAGLHGDEVTGVYASYKLIEELHSAPVNGEVTIIPIVNVLGFMSRIRFNPIDMVDLNRVFPEGQGSPLTKAIIRRVWEEALTSDYIIDLHCAGLSAYQYVLALHKEFAHVKKFTEKIPWDTVVESTGLRGQLFVEASHKGIPAVIIETIGGRGYYDRRWGEALLKVIRGTLINLKVMSGNVKSVKREYYGVIKRIFAKVQGFYNELVPPSSKVKKGGLLGYLDSQEILAPCSGKVVSSANGRFVFKDEPVAGIAEEL